MKTINRNPGKIEIFTQHMLSNMQLLMVKCGDNNPPHPGNPNNPHPGPVPQPGDPDNN